MQVYCKSLFIGGADNLKFNVTDPVILAWANAGLAHICPLYTRLFCCCRSHLGDEYQYLSSWFHSSNSAFRYFFVANMARRSKIFHDIICDLNDTFVEYVKAKKRYSSLVKLS